MPRQKHLGNPPPTSVSIHFALTARPNRAGAFRAGMTAVLHAGFSFGRELPGHLVYSRDASGDEYSTADIVPAGSIATLHQAQERLAAIATYYNQSIGLAFGGGPYHVPVSSRVYDEPDMLVFSLDFAATSWQQLQQAHRSAQVTANALIDAGRIIFTLLPLNYVLIGPTALLDQLPLTPTRARLRTVPIVLLARDTYRLATAGEAPLHTEQLPRGRLIVQQWDVSTAMPAQAKQRATTAPRRNHRH